MPQPALLCESARASQHAIERMQCCWETNLHQGQTRFRAASEGQAGAQGGQVLLQGLQAVVEPPARAAAGLKLPLLLRGKHKDWDLQAGHTRIRGCWQAPSSGKGQAQRQVAGCNGMASWVPGAPADFSSCVCMPQGCITTAVWQAASGCRGSKQARQVSFCCALLHRRVVPPIAVASLCIDGFTEPLYCCLHG